MLILQNSAPFFYTTMLKTIIASPQFITPWLTLRREFGSQLSQEEHREDIHHILNKKISRSAFLLLKNNDVISFAENDYFFQPIPFLEGFYIKPNMENSL